MSDVINRFSLSCLILTDSEALGLSLTRVLRVAMGRDAPVFSLTYAESPALLTPQRIDESDVLVLDLFREYPGGIRAEGVVLAERWMYRKPFLIVSPLSISQQLRCPGYWDIEAEDSLVHRVQHTLRFPRECTEGFEHVKKRFGRFLALPPQH
uniref:Response regulatory domain-containing protein n=1 Tax=Candidatus Kentrum sp. DK TaxID=2126562 RepID=A0A450RX03_9GAMM|nr:MAG: hypothetical protein BECKDK2373B_GA0170837_100616 [Candidatus Kentron sp. DK]